MDVASALQELIRRTDLRTADRANMQTMLKKVRGGRELDYQERLNLFAYCNRYGVPAVNDRHY